MIKEGMSVKCIYTEQELIKLVPHFRLHLLKNEKVKQHLEAMFHRLGCVFSEGYELQHGMTTRNRFGEIDTSPRIVLNERLDKEWVTSGNASSEAIKYTTDYNLIIDLCNLKRGGIK